MKKITYIISASSIVIFLLCTLFHFIYQWSGYNDIVGLFAPTNESIFQHIKMTFFPIILYYGITYLIFRNKFNFDENKWATYPLITFLVTSVIITILYYTLKYGFDISSMFLDILSLFIGLVASSVLCIKLEISNVEFKIPYYVSIVVLMVIFGLLIYFNFYPIKVNFFYDKANYTYGPIKNKIID